MKTIRVIRNETYLAHFGIKGQKWGVRRFQKEDGSLTSEGKRRYKYDIDATRQKYLDAKMRYKSDGTDKNRSLMLLAKDEYKNDKIKERLSNETGITQHRRNLESYFKEQGMTSEEAQIAAYKRDRAEKIAIGAAITTAAVATAIVVKKHYDKNVDQYINEGTKFHRIQTNENLDVEGAFYAANKRVDRMKYRGLYGHQLRNGIFGNRGSNEPIYDVIVESKSKIKIASPKAAKETLSDILMNNKNSKAELLQAFNHDAKYDLSPKRKRLYSAAAKSLQNGKIDDNVYKAYNILLVNHSPNLQTIHDSFYSKLKNKGYGGLIDINDKFYSGYNAKKPCILFGGGRDFTKTASSKLSNNQIQKDYNIINALGLGKELSKQVGIISAVVGSKHSIDAHIRDSDLTYEALQYRREHPKTNKTLSEIRRMIEENRTIEEDI